MEGVSLGSRMLTARRLGFTPVRLPVEIAERSGATVRIRMKVVPTTLAPVVVHPERLEYTGRLAGYYKRLEKRSSGYFITRAEIDREHPSNLGQLLQHVPGIQIGRGRAGITGMRMRGRTCWPLVVLDGTPMPVGETDVDAFVPSSIQGIELYLGATTAPIRYMYNRDISSCGTMLIWSRGPDTDPVSSPQSAVDLEELIDRAAIYSADSVDRPATPDAAHPIHPQFPPPLFAARIRGLAIAEFVVDTGGRVEEATVGIVSSTDPLFSDAVRAALRGATYVPALKDGRAVRQLVQQPFRFDVGESEKADSQPGRPAPDSSVRN
jgi:TonB family protein